MNRMIVLLLTLTASSNTMDSKSINLDLKTSLLFEPKDIMNNKSVVLEVKTLLDKIGTILNVQQKKAPEKNTTLTDFLKNMGDNLLKYNDNEMVNLKDTVYSVINYIKGRKSSDLFADENVRLGVDTILDKYRNKGANEIRNDIKRLLSGDTGKVLIDFTTHLNTYFNVNDGQDLNKISKIFANTKKRRHLKNLVEFTINYIFHDFYNNLNDTSKAKLSKELRKVGKYLSNKTKHHKNDSEKPIKNVNSEEFLKNGSDSLEKLIQLIASENN